MVLGQMVLCNFADFSPFVMLTMLPAMVICVPLSVSTPACMLLAFATGLSVDWLSEGIIGINAASLVPVALMRKPLIRFFLGEDIITRSDSFSFRKNGLSKISFILTISTLIFLSIYVFLDGAGTRPAWFNLTRTGASLGCDLILALIVTGILTTDDRR
jgi:hypothetical protein